MKHLKVKSVKALTPPNSYSFVWICPCGEKNGATIELGHLVTRDFCMNCGAECEITVEWNNANP